MKFFFAGNIPTIGYQKVHIDLHSLLRHRFGSNIFLELYRVECVHVRNAKLFPIIE